MTLKIKIFQMKKNSIKFLAVIFTAISLISCNNEAKFQLTESGIEYKFIEQHEECAKPSYGEALVIDVDYYLYPKDSLLFSSKEVSESFRLEYIESDYEGSIDEAFGLMALGDSAIFRIDAVDFFNNATDMGVPEYIKEGDKLEFRVRLKEILTQEQIKAEEEDYHNNKVQEELDLISDYLTENEITTQPTESGLYFVEKVKGNGKKVSAGDSISVSYKGYFINGEVFDSTEKSGKPFNFKVGIGKVIPGWDEGLTYMNQGGEALLIIPSEIGYGFNGYYPYIPPYSTLIFEVKIEKVF